MTSSIYPEDGGLYIKLIRKNKERSKSKTSQLIDEQDGREKGERERERGECQ